MISARISPAFFESLGFSRDPIHTDAFVIEVREAFGHLTPQDDDCGFRLRFLPFGSDDEWVAEVTCLRRTWPEGVGFGRYVTTTEIVELLEAMQVRERGAT